MIKPEFLILKGLIQKKEDTNLYKFLSSANKSRLESIEINDDPNLEIDYFENNSLINTIHYSWFCSIIENFSQKDRSLLK